MINWLAGPLGNFGAIIFGDRWTIRQITFSALGRRTFWVYKNGSRYTPTGKYDDAVSFETLEAAKQLIEAQTKR